MNDIPNIANSGQLRLLFVRISASKKFRRLIQPRHIYPSNVDTLYNPGISLVTKRGLTE
jgi:hypothetical protein